MSQNGTGAIWRLKNAKSVAIWAAALGFGSLWGAAAHAQEETVVVTAARQAQDVQDVASNVAVMSGEEVQFVDPQVASEALNRLPGVAIHRNNGVENLPAIRSPVLTGGQSAGSFLVLEDGVPVRAAGFANVNDLWEASLDFASGVEVVRGPGSALYGSNAVHGLVNVFTPNPNEAGALYSLSGDTIGRVSGRALVRTGETGVGGYLVGVSGVHDDGWRDDSSVDRQGLLLGASWRGDWDVDLRIAAQNLNQEGAGYVVGTDAYKNESLSRANTSPDSYRDTQLAHARVTLARDFGEDLRLVITPYARWVDGDLRLFFLPSDAQELTSQTGAGVQATAYWTANEDWSFIFGADYEKADAELFEFQSVFTPVPGYVQGLHYDYDVGMENAALFGQASWQFAEEWKLVAGVRAEHVAYDYDNRAPDGDFGRFRRAADREDTFDETTPKLGVIWTPRPDSSFWVNLARGARPPQITDLYSLQTSQSIGGQGVEEIESAELGWRRSFGARRVEVTLYHMDKTGSSFRNADGVTVTDAETRHQGIEVSGYSPIGNGFDVAGWITYAEHTYQSSDTVARAGESYSEGDDVDSAPHWIWNGRLGWTPTSALRAELEWVHMGEYFTNASNTRSYPGHDVFNVRASWDAGGGVTLFGAVRNVLDEAYAERADFAFGNDRYFPGEPLAATLGVRYQQ